VVSRNGEFAPWVNSIDMRLQQEMPGIFKGNKGVLSLDFMNVGNLLNRRWGQVSEVGFPSMRSFVNYAGTRDGKMVYSVHRSGCAGDPDRLDQSVEVRAVVHPESRPATSSKPSGPEPQARFGGPFSCPPQRATPATGAAGARVHGESRRSRCRWRVFALARWRRLSVSALITARPACAALRTVAGRVLSANTSVRLFGSFCDSAATA
jgi:hypothetical protein